MLAPQVSLKLGVVRTSGPEGLVEAYVEKPHEAQDLRDFETSDRVRAAKVRARVRACRW